MAAGIESARRCAAGNPERLAALADMLSRRTPATKIAGNRRFTRNARASRVRTRLSKVENVWAAMRCCRCKGRRQVRSHPPRRKLPRHSPLLSNRLVALLARTVGVQVIAACATDLNAVIASSTLALFAHQRAHAIGDVANGIERLEAGNFGVEAGLGVFVEQLKRVLGVIAPVTIYLSGTAADPG